MQDFYDLDESLKNLILETDVGKDGSIISRTEGLTGQIYIFDKGQNTHPRYICVKIPLKNEKLSQAETNKRFLSEMETHLSFYNHCFVHFPFDFNKVLNIPTTSFRYWGNDLKKVIIENEESEVSKLAMLLYACVGLRHCFSKGLTAHQDLKPANIFIYDSKNDFPDLPNLDVYKISKLADFGLANASIKNSVFDGARPFMAPEQWGKRSLSQTTDIFALGVIFYMVVTSGYHPVGVRLYDYWPDPKNGNSKKWTREKSWKKWADSPKVSLINKFGLEDDLLRFINKMLSRNQLERPDINSVINYLLYLIEKRSAPDFRQVEFLIDYFDNESPKGPVEKEWPYLNEKWLKLKKNLIKPAANN